MGSWSQPKPLTRLCGKSCEKKWAADFAASLTLYYECKNTCHVTIIHSIVYLHTVEAHYMDLCSHTKYVQRILNSQCANSGRNAGQNTHFLTIKTTTKNIMFAVPVGKMKNALSLAESHVKKSLILRGQKWKTSAQEHERYQTIQHRARAKSIGKHSKNTPSNLSSCLFTSSSSGNLRSWPYIYIYIHV